jgi:hypothetical protein
MYKIIKIKVGTNSHFLKFYKKFTPGKKAMLQFGYHFVIGTYQIVNRIGMRFRRLITYTPRRRLKLKWYPYDNTEKYSIING